RYLPGTGVGFGDVVSSNGHIGGITEFENNGTSAGVTPSGVKTLLASNGRADSSETEAPSGFSDPSLSGNISFSTVESIQRAGFVDMNGDGLPDQVSVTWKVDQVNQVDQINQVDHVYLNVGGRFEPSSINSFNFPENSMR
ncbi:hypothetical protein S1OALGB6SA_1631, partial [Olavius algarvensis spirochete endosymbiont]|uniref:hypothetical protein n=1 Tax=Olavius algarvensis spirochete endosymbiont TaxID=260710 RepID=UPI000F11A925